ncbi:Hydroxyacylglutathione hydrolase [Limihaloglobus sulfuriphilus]|uniref:Hydroxyacylglutathione hydrolase n=1 Tax=Limihaloglobus sulfuriphilus TaxID=1851148 RepID=A0A1Q2MHN9_9BACT|nr:MBL fold metallo-hydrolase [Limihaloglobus sulfuriphilus]AQQ71772.1 Hydroxyacylglutathione hydrolase [Limihaloglobus sulfuriphilus]
MIIETVTQGSYQTNSYILRGDNSSECVIIDTGMDNKELLARIDSQALKPEALLLTHGHLDHIIGVPDLRDKYPGIKVCIHENDAAALNEPERNMSAHSAIYRNFTTAAADIILEDGKTYSFAGMDFKVLHTPGHTPGCICLYCESEAALFTGDTVFAGSVGRTDFPGYDTNAAHQQLLNAVREKVFALPDDTKLYPGHGPSTTLRCEKKYNPFFNGQGFDYM